jgi:tetratricopeptide (TPR) repeat protein
MTTSIAVLVLTISHLFVLAAAQAVQSAAVHNPRIAKHLGEAQKQSDRKQWSAALASVRKAQAVPNKSAYAEYKISEFLAYVLTQQQSFSEAATVFEQMVSSKQASAEARLSHLGTAAQLYYQAKNYPRAAALARQTLAKRVGDAQLLELLAQAEYLTGNFKSAADTLLELIALSEKGGSKPKEGWLQTLLSSYDRLQDRSAANATWEKLLREYPKPEYWQAVLSARTAGRQPRPVELGYQRLMFDLGMLANPVDFEDLAMGAIDLGAPGEAVRVLQQGLQQKIFAGHDERRFRRMLDYAKQETAKRSAQLSELTRNAQRASTGQLSIAVGRLHLGAEQYDQAAVALRQGLEKGNLSNSDQGRIDLGIALLKSHQPEQARKAFESIAENSEWHDLGELWSLRTQGEM